jgi:hypothetical protein
MRYDFVNCDDPEYVTANLHVQAEVNADTVKWAFLNPVVGNWHPLTVISHMLDCQLFGLNPWGHHLTSVLFHAFNAVLVFLLLQRLSGATWRSLLVAAMFAVHPLHVESVAWVAERKDVLSGGFGLLSLIFFVRYAQTKQALSSQPFTRDYFLALPFLAPGLMSKPMLVTWPFVMLLLDYWPLGRLQPSDFGPSSAAALLGSAMSGIRSRRMALNPQTRGAAKRSEDGSLVTPRSSWKSFRSSFTRWWRAT